MYIFPKKLEVERKNHPDMVVYQKKYWRVFIIAFCNVR